MAVSCDAFHNAGRQKILRRSAIKDPIFSIGQIWETFVFAYIEANGGLFYIDIEIIFFHQGDLPGLITKLAPEAFQLEARRPGRRLRDEGSRSPLSATLPGLRWVSGHAVVSGFPGASAPSPPSTEPPALTARCRLGRLAEFQHQG